MKISIDTAARTLTVDGRKVDLYSREGFEIVSDLWVKVGWAEKYSYTFSWAGAPIIQLPEDMIRYQELLWELRPDVIVETGVAHGGSLIYSASLCRLIGKGRVIGVDIEIRPHNRERIESHPFAESITLFEGSSTAPDIVAAVRSAIRPGEKVLVVLDSDHSYKHVLDELRAYAPLVTPGSFIIATDGIMKDLHDAPRAKAEWRDDNPTRAAADFAAENADFVLEEPTWPFNESNLKARVTHWPGAYVKKVR
ncbi:MAG: cephalosporin hydroxylase family protein [Alphaproteobacteria bacterium]|nr:cephalosporin hydroxylase family protein [Alphaproteobacteria bacterium]